MIRRLFLIALLVAANVAAAADIDTLRQQFIGYYTAAGASASAPRMASALDGMESTTRQITGPDWLAADGHWYDIDYSGAPAGGWGPWDHTRRLIVMAKAYNTPGQGLYHDAKLRGQIGAALAYTKNFYGATIIPTGNWWFWTIGIPLDLGPTLVLMRGNVDPQTYDDLVLAMRVRIGTSPTQRGLVGPTPVGENLVWSSFTHLCLGLLEDDPAMLAAVRDAMAAVTRPTTAEGIQTDASFHQHGAQLYTGGYGGSFANDVAKYALLARNTAYALPADSLASFADYVADGIVWSLYGNYFDVSVIGREVARPSTTGFNGIAALLQASQFASPRSSEIQSAAAKMLATWNGTMPTELAGLAAKVETARHASGWPSGHRHYFDSDYTIHRRPSWFASVKMFSTRTKSGENTNDENILGSRASDGRFSLTLSGNEWFGRDIWPALDWTRLPGITVEQKPGAADDTFGYGTRTFAGGTGDAKNGVSAMELAPLGSSLFARKSWFFFDDAIVFLTSGITSPSQNRVETIVNQWPLVSASAQLVRKNDWAHLENVGYWFPSPTTNLRTLRETRSGTWASLGASDDTTPRAQTFVTLWFDHGAAPVNAMAEYVIVPNISQTAMAAWAAARPLSILANNDVAAAVRDVRNGNTGITFWRAGSVDGVQSSAPAVVYMTTSSDGKSMDVWAADPNANATGTFSLTIPGVWTTSSVAHTRTVRSIALTIPRKGGQTTHVVLTKPVTKHRAVR